MIKQLAHLAPLLIIATASWATTVNPCPIDTMTAYTASGFSCTVGNLTFSNFTFLPASLDNVVDATPVSDTNSTGLQFTGPFGAGPGMSFDAAIGFTISAASASITGETLSMLGFGAVGNGSVQINESVCPGGTITAAGTCSTGKAPTELTVFDNSSGVVASQTTTFASAVSEVSVLKDIIVLGGTSGVCTPANPCSAGVSEVINTVPGGGGGGTTGGGTTPEPDSMLLLGTGLVAASLLVRRRVHRV